MTTMTIIIDHDPVHNARQFKSYPEERARKMEIVTEKCCLSSYGAGENKN